MNSPRASLTRRQDIPLTAISVFARDMKRWVRLPLPCPYPCSTAFLSQPFFLVCTFVHKVQQALPGQILTRECRLAMFLTFRYATSGKAKAIEQYGRNKRVTASVPRAWATILSMLVTVSFRKCPVFERFKRAQPKAGTVVGEGTSAGPFLKLFCSMKYAQEVTSIICSKMPAFKAILISFLICSDPFKF